MEPKKLARAVIKYELVELTGSAQDAVVLNQFIYWSERIKDVDKYIQEETQRMENEGTASNVAPSYGWIYKAAEELCEETMLTKSASTMRRIINRLIEGGWIEERNNPNHKWDRKLQYRVNLNKIQLDLESLGYALEGYTLANTNLKNAKTNLKNGHFNMTDQSAKMTDRTDQTDGAIAYITNKDHDIDYQHHDHVYHGEDLLDFVNAKLGGQKVDARVFEDIRKRYTTEYILAQAEFIQGRTQISNAAGAFVRAVSEDWASRQPTASRAVEKANTSDSERPSSSPSRGYDNFYELFPDLKGREGALR